jgi:hypothetical protein
MFSAIVFFLHYNIFLVLKKMKEKKWPFLAFRSYKFSSWLNLANEPLFQNPDSVFLNIGSTFIFLMMMGINHHARQGFYN